MMDDPRAAEYRPPTIQRNLRAIQWSWRLCGVPTEGVLRTVARGGVGNE